MAFRKRLLVILLAFALVPAVVLTVGWSVAVGKALPLFSEDAAWQKVAESGTRALDSLRRLPMSPGQRASLRLHEQELAESLTQARRFNWIAERSVRLMIITAVVTLAFIGLVASRVAGHLSRQMSRPLKQLVGWTNLIARGEPLPPELPLRGAPEFTVLRERMRRMSGELAEGRSKALEAERGRAFRESARRFAHELKNPLTPMQFALARLEREGPPELAEALEVLRTETARLEQMSRAFAQFGRLPEGPMSDVDVGELVRYTARAVVPPDVGVHIEVEEGLPMVHGQHDALQRALSNVLLNAVDACGAGGTVRVDCQLSRLNGSRAVTVRIRDSGAGIAPDRIENIWEPYVTSKPGGTGLGLAIARQTILAHHGSVAAESVPGSGTEIRFVLPVEGNGDGRPSTIERLND